MRVAPPGGRVLEEALVATRVVAVAGAGGVALEDVLVAGGGGEEEGAGEGEDVCGESGVEGVVG